ncbi:MAG TPA: methyltransferase domain-containing protein [Edaphobacter sp.]|jgi:SAM-dependent methyltransferase|nr:methyltransferase domain-containing protein [Edaphobacter sp.]
MTTLEAPTAATTTTQANFQRYYEEAGPDYAAWSPHFNMHFGFFRWGMNPFRREAMLEQMNLEILDRLQLTGESPAGVPARDRTGILDMGCGLSATLRSFARRLPEADLNGITLVPWQLEQGRHLNTACPEGRHITLTLGDYQHTPYPSASFDAVYAIESSCYAHGANKSAFLQEAHRLLRPGGRIVVADGFLGPGKLRGPQKSLYHKLCKYWVIDTFGEVEKFAHELERLGFSDIVVEKIQVRVTPSVLHVPWVTLKFLLTTVLFGERKMTRARWNNILAPILLPFVSSPIGPVAYYIISATRT